MELLPYPCIHPLTWGILLCHYCGISVWLLWREQTRTGIRGLLALCEAGGRGWACGWLSWQTWANLWQWLIGDCIPSLEGGRTLCGEAGRLWAGNSDPRQLVLPKPNKHSMWLPRKELLDPSNCCSPSVYVCNIILCMEMGCVALLLEACFVLALWP